MTHKEQTFTLADVAKAFQDLRDILDAQHGAETSTGRFLLDDVETDILRLMTKGLTEAEQAEIAKAAN